MRPSLALQLAKVQLTLFTRANCGLCDVAKSRIVEFNKKQSQPVKYSEVDIMEQGQEKWKDSYDFDVPVLHIDRISNTGKDFQPSLDAACKLMHRFTVEEVENAVRKVEGSSP
jgi:glutaredoxin